MRDSFILSLFLLTAFMLSMGIEISYAQMPLASNPSSNQLAISPSPAQSNKILPPISSLPPLTNFTTSPPPPPSFSSSTTALPLSTQSSSLSNTFPLDNNTSQFVGTNNQFTNNTSANSDHGKITSNSDQIINNFSTLPSLYNSTANSVVTVTSFNATNHSISKTGTGFIYNYQGKSSILTVSNLFTGNNDITVTFLDGSSYQSTIDGYDPLTTIAVLSAKNIPPIKLIPLKLANSSNLKVGQVVSAIGNTMGYSNLLSTGIISGLGKFIPAFGQNISGSNVKIPNGVTTNLNLGYGYGGSPLLDFKGQVIGMNIGNYSTSATSQAKNNGISFAIPSNSIGKIVPSLLNTGFYAHPWLGAYGVDVDLDIAKAQNLTESKGFLVIAVANNSPAKKAGILGGDNITNINGRKITLGGDIILKVDNTDIQNSQDLSGYIENKKSIGDDMLVTLLRNGIIQLIHVKLEANPNYSLPLK
ncbi:MAG: S1C family serine protease [Candidatus Nitrosocosmicus sp.]